MTAERLSKILYARNLVGLLIAPLPVPAGHLHLDWDKFSAVALGYSMEWPPLSRIVNQQYHAMRMALSQIQKLGYRRFGLAMRLMFDRSDHDHWTAAFLVDQHHRPPVEQVPLFVVPDPNWSQDAFKKWFLESRPGVVLSLHDEVLQWIKGMGLKVPQDVGFVHLNCPEASGRYAGIYHNGMAVGSAAVDYVVDMIHRNERGIPSPPKWILVEGNWQHGATLKGP
jgi:DNA-binding LacI/PurR family transcriptional regulator